MCQKAKALHTLILHFQVRRDEQVAEPSHEESFIELFVKLSPRKYFNLLNDYLEKMKRLLPDLLTVMFQISKQQLFEVVVDLNIRADAVDQKLSDFLDILEVLFDC